VRTADVNDLIARKSSEGLAPQTVNHLRGFISRAYSMAIERGWWTAPTLLRGRRSSPFPNSTATS
jgi:hypothetical protein